MCAVWNWWRTAGLSLATCVAAPTSSVWSVVFAPDGKSICVGTRAGPQLVPTPPPSAAPQPEAATSAASQPEPPKP